LPHYSVSIRNKSHKLDCGCNLTQVDLMEPIMSLAPLEAIQNKAFNSELSTIAILQEICEAVLAGEHLRVVLHPLRSARIHFLDQLVPVLRVENVRVIRVTSPDGAPLDLPALMDQVIGSGEEDGPDRVERFYATLTTREADEVRLALIIDDAHLLTNGTLTYLDLLVSTARMTDVPLQLLLAGSPDLWKHLPATGSFAADKIGTPVMLPSVPVESREDVDAEGPHDPTPVPNEITGSVESSLSQGAVEDASVVASDTSPAVKAHDALAVAKAKIVVSLGVHPKKSRAGVLVKVVLLGVLGAGGGLATLWFQGHTPEWNSEKWLATMSYPWQQVGGLKIPQVVDAGAPPAQGDLAVVRLDPVSSQPSVVSEPAILPRAVPSARPNPANNAPVIIEPPTQTPLAEAPALRLAAPVRVDEPLAPGTQAQVNPAVPQGTAGSASAIPDANPVSSGMVAILIARGDALFRTGDVLAARLMYDRAAGSGSGLAAVAMGMTFDPLFLATIGVHAVAPDPKRAIIWYQRASDLGSAEGTRLLAQLRTTIIP
jgi:hypothetical protein